MPLFNDEQRKALLLILANATALGQSQNQKIQNSKTKNIAETNKTEINISQEKASDKEIEKILNKSRSISPLIKIGSGQVINIDRRSLSHESIKSIKNDTYLNNSFQPLDENLKEEKEEKLNKKILDLGSGIELVISFKDSNTIPKEISQTFFNSNNKNINNQVENDALKNYLLQKLLISGGENLPISSSLNNTSSSNTTRISKTNAGARAKADAKARSMKSGGSSKKSTPEGQTHRRLLTNSDPRFKHPNFFNRDMGPLNRDPGVKGNPYTPAIDPLRDASPDPKKTIFRMAQKDENVVETETLNTEDDVINDNNNIISKEIEKDNTDDFQSRIFQIEEQSEGIDSSGLSTNHDQFSEDVQKMERMTARRREEPKSQSRVDKNKYYSKSQTAAKNHLRDFGYNKEELERMTSEEAAAKVESTSEYYLGHPNTEEYKGTLSLQENVNIYFHEEDGVTLMFEDNPLYEGLNEQHFISIYKPNNEAQEELQSNQPRIIDKDSLKPGLRVTPADPDGLTFKTRGPNLGQPIDSQLKEKQLAEEAAAKEEAREEVIKELGLKPTYQQLQPTERISNRQKEEVLQLRRRLSEDPDFHLNNDQKNILERAERYEKAYDELDRIREQTIEEELERRNSDEFDEL